MKIGFTELILVAIVAFVVIGPDKLPEYARKLGKMLRELKKYTGAASEEIQKNVVEPLKSPRRPPLQTRPLPRLLPLRRLPLPKRQRSKYMDTPAPAVVG